MDRRHDIPGFLGWAAVVALAWVLAGLGTDTNTEWYRELAKPRFQPPGWVFGVVWTLLYTAMAVASWDVWRRVGWRDGRRPLGAFCFQLVLNALSPWLFFTWQIPGVAGIVLVVLGCGVLVTTLLFFRISRHGSLQPTTRGGGGWSRELIAGVGLAALQSRLRLDLRSASTSAPPAPPHVTGDISTGTIRGTLLLNVHTVPIGQLRSASARYIFIGICLRGWGRGCPDYMDF